MYQKLDDDIQRHLSQGTVIPAHPLALHPDLTINTGDQRRLTRYYMASGAGGIAVGVHTTQFEIRQPEFNMLENVLRLAAEEIEQARNLFRFIGLKARWAHRPESLCSNSSHAPRFFRTLTSVRRSARPTILRPGDANLVGQALRLQRQLHQI